MSAMTTEAPLPVDAPLPIDFHRNRTLWLLSIAHAVNHAQAVLLPLVYIRIIVEFGVTADTIALLAAAGSFASGAVQLSYAKLTRMISRRKLLAAGGVLYRRRLRGPGAWRRRFPTFALVNIASRIGGSPQHPVGNAILAEQFPEHRRGFAISAHISGGNVGTVAVALLGARLIADLGWRETVVLFGVPAVIIALGDPLLRPRERRRPGRGRRPRQRPRRVRDDPPRPRPPLDLPGVGARRRRARARRRQPLRAALPDARTRAAAGNDGRACTAGSSSCRCRCRSSPAGCPTGSGGSR